MDKVWIVYENKLKKFKNQYGKNLLIPKRHSGTDRQE